jgi:hypothetical protein
MSGWAEIHDVRDHGCGSEIEFSDYKKGKNVCPSHLEYDASQRCGSDKKQKSIDAHIEFLRDEIDE